MYRGSSDDRLNPTPITGTSDMPSVTLPPAPHYQAAPPTKANRMYYVLGLSISSVLFFK